ncbi:pyridoxamine 5'-phosphate oxidase family protein [Nonomuraea sp. NPDC051941]|uniref:pyridoxamine 5'-phosphate oxidase family protein n=1 Tax=Nonomuraea sp. NPDC051941 TaxID=3364373 RepID=UPI0037C78F30
MTATPIDLEVGAIIDAYRTCEFATLGADGTPLTWPTAAWRRADGTLLVTTSLAFAQKALNVRRDGRVALLFSDPPAAAAPMRLRSSSAEPRPAPMRSGPGRTRRPSTGVRSSNGSRTAEATSGPPAGGSWTGTTCGSSSP